ncbi:hypothetical protein BD410DRAFT_795332 [Rickenella mellea]|uniref:F-box domain-containing protein n=1 Tax=Rickenella mellea TaxID=50990 RepID=A0A4Y7PM38_9AGAM|nr:hypothetical protein BD410DRAFT_795332 [Rickenella mellea]
MTPTLPPELWRGILQFATSDGVDYNLGRMRGDSLKTRKTQSEMIMHMKTKVDITRVSRLFNQIGAEFLYEHVRIEDANRAVKLFERLSAAGPNGPRQWIKVIVVDNVESRGDPPESDIAAATITGILRLCADLRGFFWFHPMSGAHFKSRKSSEEMMTHIPRNIQIFRWSADVECPTFAAFLHKASTSLRVLVIMGYIDCHCTAHSPITFPSLTHLALGKTTNALNSLGPMPSLTEFTLRACDYNGDNILARVLTPERTKALRVVRFGYGVRVHVMNNFFAPMLVACPILQEIHYYSYLGHPSSTPWTSDLSHPTLQHLSVIAMGKTRYRDLQNARSELCLHLLNISASRFPSLDTVTVDRVLFGSAESTDFTRLMLRRVTDDFSSAEISII